jgi:signal transduction histidine kinase
VKFKGRLFYSVSSIFLPLAGIFFLAAVNLFYSQKNIEAVARLYVEHFTQNASRDIDRGDPFQPRRNFTVPGDINPNYEMTVFQPARHFPIMAAVLDSGGNFIYGSDRLKTLMRDKGDAIPVGLAEEIINAGERFTAVKFPASSGLFWVAGAISWKDMPGKTTLTFLLWPALVVALVLWTMLSAFNFWTKIIKPMDSLAARISSLKWGRETLGEPAPDASASVRKVHETLALVSRDAVRISNLNRSSMRDLVNMQEDERTKISRDIHDGPLQDVTALIQRIRLARRPDNSDDETKRELDFAEKIAYTTVKEMRALCDFLNPPWLELGLSQALTELTERQSLQYGVKISLWVDETLELSDTVTLAFFRIVQEAVTNSVRHGEAKNIWIDIKKNGEGIELTVQDDGHGFDAPPEDEIMDLRAEGHRGLSNMEERMTLIGGRLKIISYRGEGACIRGLLP